MSAFLRYLSAACALAIGLWSAWHHLLTVLTHGFYFDASWLMMLLCLGSGTFAVFGASALWIFVTMVLFAIFRPTAVWYGVVNVVAYRVPLFSWSDWLYFVEALLIWIGLAASLLADGRLQWLLSAGKLSIPDDQH